MTLAFFFVWTHHEFMDYRKVGLAVIGVIAIVFTRMEVETFRENKPHEFLSPPKDLQYFTFGYREPFADMLWLRAIQDFDYCEKQLKADLCKGNSWLSQMLDLTTDLSPRFRMAYSAGAMALTIIISDIEGASKLFNKGVLAFPNDWIILYKAAYHAIYEENNMPKAAYLVERAARNGAPDWVWSLAANLYSEGGQRMLAMKVVEELEAMKFNPAVIRRIKERLGIAGDP